MNSQHLSKALIIANPIAGRHRGASIPQLLAKSNLNIPIWETEKTGHACELTRKAIGEGYTTIIAAGGDGTLGEVVNSLLTLPQVPNVVLGVLPVGTGNDFARCIGIGTEISDAIETLKSGEVLSVDAGQVKTAQESCFFINVAGAGFDALVAQRINNWRSHPFWGKVRGTAAYLGAVVTELKPFRAANLRLELDGEVLETRAVLCAIANAQSYGGGMKVAPQARIDDGYFDICLIHEVSRTEFLRAFPGVFSGSHVHHPKVSVHRARRVVLHCEPALPVLVDGEVIDCTPASFEIVPQALRFLAPKAAFTK